MCYWRNFSVYSFFVLIRFTTMRIWYKRNLTRRALPRCGHLSSTLGMFSNLVRPRLGLTLGRSGMENFGRVEGQYYLRSQIAYYTLFISLPLRFEHSITRNGLKVMSMMFEDGQGGISSAVGNPVSPPHSLFNVTPISLKLESTDGDSGRWGYPHGRYAGPRWRYDGRFG